MKIHTNLLFLALFVALLSLLGGCSSSSARWASWAEAEGGILKDPARSGRAERAIEKLVDTRTPVSVHVLDNANVTAYSYADGHIFVTRGLVDAATDDELAAAIAHELGHLVSDGHLHGSTYRAFAGIESDDKEMQADAVGARLLIAAKVKTSAMITILEKVRKASPSAATRSAIAERIRRLYAELAVGKTR